MRLMGKSASLRRRSTPFAIARALSSNPRILIFDEATNALDYESEAIIQRNMRAICQGRTVFIIAHRLSAVRNSHRIIAMDKGRIVEMGTHEQLLAKPRGLYAHLWAMQDGSARSAEKPEEGAPRAPHRPASMQLQLQRQQQHHQTISCWPCGVTNKDVGFVSAGQGAEIKLETFPFTRYGTVPAQVSTISADAVNDEKRGAIFPAVLMLQQTSIHVDGKTIKLTPGMNLTAEIKTGKRRVIDYLLNPVQKHLGESLKER